jgi:glutamate-1-semialdehyde 2,1-aminomutase
MALGLQASEAYAVHDRAGPSITATHRQAPSAFEPTSTQSVDPQGAPSQPGTDNQALAASATPTARGDGREASEAQVAGFADARSRELLRSARRFLPGGVNTAKRKIAPALCVRRGQGAYIETLDGARLLDHHCAYGAVFLGYAYPEISARVWEEIRTGLLFGVGVTELELEAAQKIVKHVPCAELVLMCGSGSEATFHAIRLARAATGRERILKFQGCYHGSHDYLALNYLSAAERLGAPDPFSAGIPADVVNKTLVCRFNDLNDVEAAFARHPEQIAAVIVEPVAHNAGSIMPAPDFLPGLRAICDREGTILIFDEVITGFRHALGGYQSIAGVRPDLTTLAKALGNGFPVAALVGSHELMSRFSTTPHGDVWFAGTYNGNAVGLAAAVACIEILEREPVHEHVFRLGERMRCGLRSIAADAGIPAVVSGFGSVFALLFMDGPLRSYEDVLRNNAALQVAFRRELLAHGVFEIPENLGRSHLLYSHSDEDIDLSLEAAAASLTAVLHRCRSGSHAAA